MNSNRILWMDFLRGLCILLVILQHWISSVPQNIIDTMYVYEFFLEIKSFFAPYRMELLFFLSGLIVIKSIKKNDIEYNKGKINNLIYPYIIWSLIYFILYNLGNLIKGNFYNIGLDLLSILLGGSDITWFLYYLFIYFMTIKFVRKFKTYMVLISILLLYFISYNLNFYKELNVGFLRTSDLFYYFLFFYLADQLNVKNLDILKFSKKKFVAISSIFFLFIVHYINIKFDFKKTDIVYFIPVLFSIPFFIIISNFIAKKNNILSLLIFHFSKFSIVYYLSHMVIIYLGFVLFKFLKFSGYSYILIFILSLIIPFLYIKVANRYKLLWKFFKIS